MIGTVIGLIFVCIILGFAFWAFQQLMPLIAVAEPFATIIRILIAFLILVIVLWFAAQILGMAGIHVPTFDRL